MYKILNWFFGWDYIAWSNWADQGIAKVRIDGMGRVWYWRYRSISSADYIIDPKDVIWLTCSPSKYFKDYK